ncbi:MAG: hypothetical protein WC175_06455 [Candidatus Dojkabacteria bacterium]
MYITELSLFDAVYIISFLISIIGWIIDCFKKKLSNKQGDVILDSWLRIYDKTCEASGVGPSSEFKKDIRDIWEDEKDNTGELLIKLEEGEGMIEKHLKTKNRGD